MYSITFRKLIIKCTENVRKFSILENLLELCNCDVTVICTNDSKFEL